MNARKFPHLLALLLFAGPVTAEEPAAPAEAEVSDEASALFQEFTSLMEANNPARAIGPFQKFLTLGDPVKDKLQGWLDERWESKKRAYLFEAARLKKEAKTGGDGKLSAEARARLTAGQESLAAIRQLPSEDEMKKKLAEDGWGKLQQCLDLRRPSKIKAMGAGAAPAAAPDAKLQELLVIGRFRYELRKARGSAPQTPEEDLGLDSPPDPEEAEKTIAAKGDAAAVLRENEKFKDEIPGSEYEGILELNHWRIAAGMGPLTIDPKLCEAARDHSADMAKHGFFAHESPIEGKTTPWDRAKNFGTSARAENIAVNGSTSGANRAWFHSPGHHKNMFNPGLKTMGLGVSGRHYTQMFR